MDYSRITIETVGGKLIDIVEREEYSLHEFFILKSDLKKLLNRVNELGGKKIDNYIARLLISERLMHRKK